MSRGAQLVIEARPDGRWAIGPEAAIRGPRLFDSKAAALAHARSRAERIGSTLIIRGQGGRIEQQTSG